MIRDTVVAHDTAHAGIASTSTGTRINPESERSGEVVEIELAAPAQRSAQRSRQAMMAAFREERRRAAATPEPQRVIEDLIGREGEGSLRRDLGRQPD